ncbi:hypothetical protein FPV67DRAFT_1506790 [Lyophyllum atratum]|nr:hypothetical protein FPV67DRAFT_1506790 [Lyophyllum atratum]
MLSKSIAAFITLAVSLSSVAYANVVPHTHGESHSTHPGHDDHTTHTQRTRGLERRMAGLDAEPEGILARDLLPHFSTRDLIDEIVTRSKISRRGGASSTMKAYSCTFCGAAYKTRAELTKHHNSKHAKDYGTI